MPLANAVGISPCFGGGGRDPFAAAYSDALLVLRADAALRTLSGSNVVALRAAYAAGGFDITLTQGTVSKGPTVSAGWSNGRDALLYASANLQHLVSGAFPGGARAQPTTIYCVFSYTITGTKILYDSNSTSNVTRQAVNTAGNQLSMYAGTSLTSVSSPVVPGATKHVSAAVYDGASSRLYVDGSSVAGPATAGTQSISGVALGASLSGGTDANHWDGAIAFYVLCAGAHDASTVAARTTYLRSAAEYGF